MTLSQEQNEQESNTFTRNQQRSTTGKKNTTKTREDFRFRWSLLNFDSRFIDENVSSHWAKTVLRWALIFARIDFEIEIGNDHHCCLIVQSQIIIDFRTRNLIIEDPLMMSIRSIWREKSRERERDEVCHQQGRSMNVSPVEQINLSSPCSNRREASTVRFIFGFRSICSWICAEVSKDKVRKMSLDLIDLIKHRYVWWFSNRNGRNSSRGPRTTTFFAVFGKFDQTTLPWGMSKRERIDQKPIQCELPCPSRQINVILSPTYCPRRISTNDRLYFERIGFAALIWLTKSKTVGDRTNVFCVWSFAQR